MTTRSLSTTMKSALGPLAIAAALAIPLGLAHSAQAYKSTYRAQPGHPASSLAMSVKGKPRAGKLVTLTVTGSNQPFPEPFDPDFPDRHPLDYTLDVFVQDRSVFPTCAPSETEQIDKLINVPGKVKQIASVLNAGMSGPFKKVISYRSGSPRRIMFCAYIRYSAVDDIVMSSLKHNLAKKRPARKRGSRR